MTDEQVAQMDQAAKILGLTRQGFFELAAADRLARCQSKAGDSAPAAGESEEERKRRKAEREHQWWCIFNRMDAYRSPEGGWNHISVCAFVAGVLVAFSGELIEHVVSINPQSCRMDTLAQAIGEARSLILNMDWKKTMADDETLWLRLNFGATLLKVGDAAGGLCWGLLSREADIRRTILETGDPARVLPLAEALAIAELWCHGEGYATELEKLTGIEKSPIQKEVETLKSRLGVGEAAPAALRDRAAGKAVGL
jgi:hypothetical protein